jgi:hypothetical protein
MIDNPSSCKIHIVTHFLHAENMREGTVCNNNTDCSKMGEQMFAMKMISQLSVVSNDLVRSVDQKFMKDGTSQFQNLCMTFHEFCTLFGM